VHELPAVQAVQVLLAEQIGVVPEQSAWATHWTHLLLVVSQTGVLPEQLALLVHWTQAPLVAHATRLGSASPEHGLVAEQPVQVWPAEQMGAVPEHCALERHWTHLLVAVSQAGVVPGQSGLPVHSTQAPVLAQTARNGSPRFAHWPEAVHAAQVLFVLSQMGRVGEAQ